MNYQYTYKKNLDILFRIFVLIIILVTYRFGTYITIPGVNYIILKEMLNNYQKTVLGMINILTGGSISRMSLFSLNIIPYITSSIIINLYYSLCKKFFSYNNMKISSNQINKYSKYLTFIVSVFQSYFLTINLEFLSYNNLPLVKNPGYLFRIIGMFSLIAGSFIVIWLSEKIDNLNVGNGTSIIIFSNIVSGIFSSFYSIFEITRNNFKIFFFIIIYIIITSLLVIFVEKSYKKIIINYPKQQIGKKSFNNRIVYMPIKINVSGVMPAIFAHSVLLIPKSFTVFLSGNSIYIQKFIFTYLHQGKILFLLLYMLLIILFCFFYSNIALNLKEITYNFRKHGAIIPGRRPGLNTFKFLKKVLKKLNIIGAIYITFICIFPEFITLYYNIPIYLGGTSVLIVISVFLDFIKNIKSLLIYKKYSNLYHKNNIMEGN